MTVEAPIKENQKGPKNQWLVDRLSKSGFQPIENYNAMFFVETKRNGEVIDHMILSTTEEGMEMALGVFSLRRWKGETDFEKYLREYPQNRRLQQAETLNKTSRGQVSFSVAEAKTAFEKKNLPEANLTALFAKWYDGRMHTFVLDEEGEIVTIYSINPDKIQTSKEYIENMKEEIIFQQNREEYDDNRHP